MQRVSSTSKLRNSKSLNEKKKCSLVPRSVSFGLKIQESSHEGQFPVLGPTSRTTCFLYVRFGFMRIILANTSFTDLSSYGAVYSFWLRSAGFLKMAKCSEAKNSKRSFASKILTSICSAILALNHFS